MGKELTKYVYIVQIWDRNYEIGNVAYTYYEEYNTKHMLEITNNRITK